jgi:F-type H+-transporting ATPase subunit delta
MVYIDNNAKNYGDALFMLAKELDEIDIVKNDFEILCKSLEQNADYLKLLDTPSLSREERVKLVDSAFNGLNENLVNMVKILAERRLIHLIFKIHESYLADYDEHYGIERVEAISAIPLSIEQLEKLKSKLEKVTGKQIIVTNTIDSSILGGMKLRYGGVQLDGSVKTRLDKFEAALRDTVI